MLRALAHRGPDDSGLWRDSSTGLVLAQRRLSIVDLSAAGRQPMASCGSRYTLVYNGEMYNFLELKRELDASPAPPPWKGSSDTEVLLAAFERWGVENTLKKFNGMFALALWDATARELWLARDRMGEKPLYFGWIQGRFAFASELTALAAVPGWTPKLCHAQIAQYLRAGFVRGPHSAVIGIFRLPPATILKLGCAELHQPMSWDEVSLRARTYWSVSAAASAGATEPFTGSLSEAAEVLEALLSDAVSLRTTADVPLGAFLSGGIDSSLIAALMQSNASSAIRTFCIGFHTAGFDEAPHARDVANRIGSEHTELYVSGRDAMDMIPRLPKLYDEPFADQSSIPTFLVSQLARQSVTVTLSGDGGDELFGGYPRYKTIPRLWKVTCPLGNKGRKAFSKALRAAAQVGERTVFRDTMKDAQLPFRLERFAERVDAGTLDEMRIAYIGGAGSSALASGVAPHGVTMTEAVSQMGPLRQLMFADQVDYLPDNILVKLDRASMAVGLESRVPFLDHRVVEFSWRLPPRLLRVRDRGKLVLRQVLARHVEPTVFERPKKGFSPPISEWLRGPLRDWAESLLSPQSLSNLPMLDSPLVRRRWQAPLPGRIDAGYALWSVLMLSAWRECHGVGTD